MAEASMPLCAPMKVETFPGEEDEVSDCPRWDFFLCLWKLENGVDNEADFCTHECKDFNALIKHVTEDHKAPLRVNIDYCPTCQILFEGPLQGIHHYVTKALNYEDFEMVRQNKFWNDAEHHRMYFDVCIQRLKCLQDQIMDQLIYQANNKPIGEASDDEEIPDPIEDQTLDGVDEVECGVDFVDFPYSRQGDKSQGD